MTDFVSREGNKGAALVVFHVYSYSGKSLQAFFGNSGEQQMETIAFLAGTEFLICKRTREYCGGLHVVNIFLREIQVGFNKQPVLWLDDKCHGSKVVNDKIRQLQFNHFDSDLKFITKSSSELALAFLKS